MATLGPRNRAQPPPYTPLDTGIVAAARAAGLVESGRWEGGVEFRPALNLIREDGSAQVQGPGFWLVCDDEQPPKDIHATFGNIDWDPYVLWDGYSCSTLGVDRTSEESRVRASLDLQTSHLIEQILAGDGTQPSSNGDFPTDADVLGATETIVAGFAYLFEALAGTLGGAQGWIHVPISLVPYIDHHSLSANGHRLVVGTGYTSDVDSGEATIYATGPVQIYLSDIETFTDIDREVNTLSVRAERLAMAAYDTHTVFAVDVCLADSATCSI